MQERGVAIAWRAALALLGAALAVEASTPVAGARRNHLAGEASPYLQLHVYNPVDWYPWGEEALERARREDKPIFLSVGYSTCYWCHVMEREVFSDPEIAKQMNASFISIKVDREERPDIDAVYLQATQILTGSGGWPNSVFLTPDAKPFFAGTYFPSRDRGGLPGFPSVLSGIQQQWRDGRAELLARADRVAAAIEHSFAAGAATPPQSFDADRLLALAVDGLAQRYDDLHGGFSMRPKFPSPYQLELLLAAHQRGVSDAALPMLIRTLDEMALGAINDQLGGGFHRYSTDRSWSVPHFEKMLYDNAQLLPLYARAHRVTGRPHYRRVAEDVAHYLQSEMTSPLGGLYSAQDAEVAGEEGASYVWTREQIESALGPAKAGEFLSVYQLTPVNGDAGDGPGALRLRLPIEPALTQRGLDGTVGLLDAFGASRLKLLEVRARRDQPLLDDKILAGWNGLAIRGLVDAGVELGRPGYIEAGARAAHFVLARLLLPDGRLRRSYVAGQAREDAVQSDYAYLADGLVALHAATGDPRWLAAARRLADRMIEQYEGPEGSGFFLVAADASPDGGLFVRPRELADNVIPSGNTVALRLLRDLAMLTGEKRYAAAAARTARALGPYFERAPWVVGTALRSLAMGPQLPAPPPDRKAGDGSRPPAIALDALPRGRDYVRAKVVPGGRARALRVLLEIDEGWHVNANPASLGFLLPTRVELVSDSGAGPTQLAAVVYPDGTSYQPRFSREALSVYEGTVGIDVELPGELPPDARLDLTFQACDSTTCLPPETLALAIP